MTGMKSSQYLVDSQESLWCGWVCLEAVYSYGILYLPSLKQECNNNKQRRNNDTKCNKDRKKYTNANKKLFWQRIKVWFYKRP